MKTCYDCIHCEACSDAGDEGFSSLKEDVSKCKHFKNKADFVEVVRCKDCIYWENGKSYTPYCNNFGSMLEDTRADDFCCFGEKK